jgi:hypothetical protein
LLWVKSGSEALELECPLCPRKRPFVTHAPDENMIPMRSMREK